MSEIINRATAAAEKALFPLTEPGTVTLWDLARAAAIAAIEAIREPTDKMASRGCHEYCLGDYVPEMPSYDGIKDAWRGMIDELLSSAEADQAPRS